MANTALGAEKEKAIIFISDAHEKFYYEKLKEVRYQDVYHKALVYCLGISDDTRRNIKSIYNFKTGCVKTECLHEGWQTSGSLKVVRMAFNLYCNGTPSVFDYDDAERINGSFKKNIFACLTFIIVCAGTHTKENQGRKAGTRPVTVHTASCTALQGVRPMK